MSDKQEQSILEASVSETVASLLPSYGTEGKDCPEGILSLCPRNAPVVETLRTLIDVMFPGRMTADSIEGEGLEDFLRGRLSHSWSILCPEIERALPFRWMGEFAGTQSKRRPENVTTESRQLMTAFFGNLSKVREALIKDVQAAYDGDPAALTFAEIKLSYPGVLAITSHRIIHELYKLDVPIVPRIMSEWTHTQTGADIHPGVKLGEAVFIDHSTGVVIGETAEIGNRVKIYQGVTLGAKSFPKDEHGNPVKSIKRHPTVEDDVVIYANATILGGDTVIGAGSTIGGNVFLTESVPPGSLVRSEVSSAR